MAPTPEYQFDIHVLDPLIRWCNILAILPRTSSVSISENSKAFGSFRWYAAFVFIFIVTGSALGIVGRFKEVYHFVPMVTLIITDMGLALSVTVTNVIAILLPSVCYLETWKMFLDNFNKTDCYLFEDSINKVKKCKEFYFNLVVGHLILVLIFLYDAYVWITAFGLIPYSAYIFRNLQYYHLFIGAMTSTNFVLALKHRFDAVNDKLRRLRALPITKGNITPLSPTTNNSKNHLSVRELSEIYATLVTQVSLFNKLFGWQILFTTLSIVIGLLHSLNLLAVYAVTRNGSFEYIVGYDVILLSSTWALWQMIVGVIGLITCGRATWAAQQTADECFSTLLKFPLTPGNSHEKNFRDEITLLRDLAVYRCPTFSAAGFFTLDYSLLLSIIGSVTSYVIVLIQFNK